MFHRFAIALAVILALSVAACFGEEEPVPPVAGGAIRLPSGTVVKIASFTAHPKWKQSFPPDQPFFAEKYAEGNLKGMHSRYSGRLDGASAVLHENGKLKMLAFYPDGQQQGACRVWDEDQRMLLYSKSQQFPAVKKARENGGCC